MQLKFKISFVLFLAFCFYGAKVSAQEEVQTTSEIHELNSHPELNLNDDKTLLMDVDAKASKSQPGNKETTNTSANTRPKTETKAATNDKAEEDPLSFNFLYFIIEKFKISDIVD